jgi:hypothetical protein
MTTPRKHHTVPQYLLRQFSVDQEGRQVHVFDKTTGESRLQAIADTGAERDFNQVEIQGRRINFESAFRGIDDVGAAVLRHLVASSAPTIDPETLSALPAIVASQLLRTKLRRTTPVEMGRQLAEQCERAGIELNAAITDGDARRMSLIGLLRGENVANALAPKDVILLEAREGSFWLSDNPVVLYNTFPYGEIGLVSPGVELYFPISPKRALAFMCPSIGKQIRESMDPDHPRQRLLDPMYERMLDAIDNRGTLDVPAEYVNFLNELQVRQSSRFLYSATIDFSLARKVLQTDPDFAFVRSCVSVGEMGDAPPQRTAMPKGEWLVVEAGTKHHAIPIALVESAGTAWPVEFDVLDLVKLAVAQKDSPFDVATIYQDGHYVRGMSGVRIEYAGRPANARARLTHVDQALNRLLDQMVAGGDSTGRAGPE